MSEEPKKKGRNIPWRGFLYDNGVMVGEVRLEDPPEHLEKLKWRRAYRINSDDPHMPTEAMAEFIRLGCCRVPFPQPKMPTKHRTKAMLDQYRDYSLAKAALDDYKDVIALSESSTQGETIAYLIDVMYSRIVNCPEVFDELTKYVEKQQDRIEKKEAKIADREEKKGKIVKLDEGTA